ncbi:hypothetical protein FHL15_002461 [Xylaria flabelliformis]|uniref:Uncharacterized protein n=1 Tax=Xylaria flabelliformis TaxID=2512241 RepID=A0A553I8N3_9PEZI|nr:hypothetical protein FHL15_002461 [Xylaria flabelliformis]
MLISLDQAVIDVHSTQPKSYIVFTKTAALIRIRGPELGFLARKVGDGNPHVAAVLTHACHLLPGRLTYRLQVRRQVLFGRRPPKSVGVDHVRMGRPTWCHVIASEGGGEELERCHSMQASVEEQMKVGEVDKIADGWTLLCNAEAKCGCMREAFKLAIIVLWATHMRAWPKLAEIGSWKLSPRRAKLGAKVTHSVDFVTKVSAAKPRANRYASVGPAGRAVCSRLNILSLDRFDRLAVESLTQWHAIDFTMDKV